MDRVRASFLQAFLIAFLVGPSFSKVLNNDPSSAEHLNINTGYNAQITPAGDVDWYRFTVPSSGVLTVTLQVPPGRDYDVDLHNSSAPAGYIDQAATVSLTEEIVANVTAGDYYVKIYGWNSSNGPELYNFRADFVGGGDAEIELTLYRVSDTNGSSNTSSPGNTKSVFEPGETLRVTLRATNSGASADVLVALNIQDPFGGLLYDSDVGSTTDTGSRENNSADSPLFSGEGYDYYSFDKVIPADAPVGTYEILGAIRDDGWEQVFDTTAPGAADEDWNNAWISSFEVTAAPSPVIDLSLYSVSDTNGSSNTSSPGNTKSVFEPGETLRVTLRATNSGASADVLVALNIQDPFGGLLYDSDVVQRPRVFLDTLEGPYGPERSVRDD